jgi:hypothetical protein
MIDITQDWLVLVLWMAMGAGIGFFGGWLKDPRHWAWALAQIKRKPYAVFREYSNAGRRYFTYIKEVSEKLELTKERSYLIDSNTSTMEYGPFGAPEFVLDSRFGATRDILSDPRITIPIKGTCPHCKEEVTTTFSGESSVTELPNPHSVSTILQAFKEDGLAIARMLYAGMEKGLAGVPNQIWIVCGIIVCAIALNYFMLSGGTSETNVRLDDINQTLSTLIEIRKVA